MGQNISIGDSLLITVFSMLLVFIVLIAISYLIDLLRVITSDKKKSKNPEIVEVHKEEVLETENPQDDKELIAVISAAIAVSMGVDIPDINIKSINRVSPPSSPWAEMGRINQSMNRL